MAATIIDSIDLDQLRADRERVSPASPLADQAAPRGEG
jgi:hypothetical protein